MQFVRKLNLERNMAVSCDDSRAYVATILWWFYMHFFIQTYNA
jgi:hypothetical protein